jgi:hypothetical protein
MHKIITQDFLILLNLVKNNIDNYYWSDSIGTKNPNYYGVKLLCDSDNYIAFIVDYKYSPNSTTIQYVHNGNLCAEYLDKLDSEIAQIVELVLIYLIRIGVKGQDDNLRNNVCNKIIPLFLKYNS